MASFPDGVIQGFTSRLPAVWPALALAASAGMLAAAHAFERFGGYAPCLLCLKQREVYWVAGAVAMAGLALLRTPAGRSLAPWLSLILAVIFLFGAGLAAYHAGAEWKWWPGPGACAGTAGSVADLDMAGLLDGTLRVRPPACDEAAWRMLGLSMAGWNALISLGLSGLGVVAWNLERRRA